ncbi:MAG: aminopeptidase [Spirochaetes bacterium GWC2_52_13]|nr:MAG: aminopeptidase [Spirochaetes bacterium GWC2_52_13]HCG64499.1 aminopeptidase [Sphaerochaeta sp.]
MTDPRERELARLLVRFSVDLQPGENCLINAVDVPLPMVEELVAAVYEVGGNPQVNLTSIRIERAMAAGATDESLAVWADCDAYRMKKMDAFIGIRGIVNPRETATLGASYAHYMQKYNTPVHHEIRVPHTKWVVLRYPTQLMAYQANMSTREFEDFFYKVTAGVDYKAMSLAMDKAKLFLDKADKVHILANGTDLSFSIKGMGSVPCSGHRNIPDGEIYSCPIRNSVNGTISYNTASTYNGHCYSDVKFTIKDGKIVEASADDTEAINALLDTDEGARYFGEFALGCNPHITFAMDNTLFDEKIAGSIHFTPGNAYAECDNGNRSDVHWDLVQIQTPEYGGGEVWIDGVLIRKDGVFVHEAFVDLNFA